MSDATADVELHGTGPRSGALISVLSVGLVLLAFLWPLGAHAAAIAAGIYAGIGAIVIAQVGAYHPFATFGSANLLTVIRAAMLGYLVPLIIISGLRDASGPMIFVLAVTILLLDGVDGWLARLQGMASRFGARFDMEVDALLVMALSSYVWLADKAGPWVLLLGLMRYLFIAAGFAVPALARDLPPSRRRKIVCVVQIILLAGMALPQIEAPLSTILAFSALVLLCWSFLVDVIWLMKARRA